MMMPRPEADHHSTRFRVAPPLPAFARPCPASDPLGVSPILFLFRPLSRLFLQKPRHANKWTQNNNDDKVQSRKAKKQQAKGDISSRPETLSGNR